MKYYKNRSYKKSRKNKSRKNKKGGFFFGKSTVASSAECDPNNLVNIKDSASMHANYQKCCPKGFMGTKNSSPYCRQLDTNFQTALKSENDALGYAGMDLEDAQAFEQMPIANSPLSQQPSKPWWKFWGGKSRRRMHTKKYKK
jgi:hypothetical protein